MSVTAVIVNYNSGDWLSRCVSHVLEEQLITNICVVDNASSDDSVEQLEELIKKGSTDRIKLIKNTVNRGFGAANNQIIDQLVEQKESDFVLLINPDCELNDGVIPAMLSHFEKDVKLGAASCVIENTDGSIQATCRRRFPTPWTALIRMSQLHRLRFLNVPNFDMGNEPMPQTLQYVEAISGAFMLVRLDAIRDVGSFDEHYFMHCEDLDWCKRFQLKGWKVGFVPEVSVLHEKGVSSRARPIGVLWNLHQGMLYFFDKFYRNDYVWPVRMLVKLGIYSSFTARAGLGFLKNVVSK